MALIHSFRHSPVVWVHCLSVSRCQAAKQTFSQPVCPSVVTQPLAWNLYYDKMYNWEFTSWMVKSRRKKLKKKEEERPTMRNRGRVLRSFKLKFSHDLMADFFYFSFLSYCFLRLIKVLKLLEKWKKKSLWNEMKLRCCWLKRQCSRCLSIKGIERIIMKRN